MNKTLLHRISAKMHSLGEAPKWLHEKLSASEQIRLIREALGMTQKQLGERTEMGQSAIAQIESKNGDMQISTLQKIARALECELIVRLVPKKEITQLLDQKSEAAARKLLSISTANTALELQKPGDKDIELVVREKQAEFLTKHRSWLWEKK